MQPSIDNNSSNNSTIKLPSEMNFLEFITFQTPDESLHPTIITDYFDSLSKRDMKPFYLFLEEFAPKIIEKYTLNQSNEVMNAALMHCYYHMHSLALSNFEGLAGLSQNTWTEFFKQFEEQNIKKNKEEVLDNINSINHSYYYALSAIGSFFCYVDDNFEDGKIHYYDYAKQVFSKLNLENILVLINKNIDKDITQMNDVQSFTGIVDTINKAALFLSEEENENLSIQFIKNFLSLKKFISTSNKNDIVYSLIHSRLNCWSPKVRNACPKFKFDSIFENSVAEHAVLGQLKNSHIEYTKFFIEKMDELINNPSNLKKPMAKEGFSYSPVNLTKVQATKMDYFNKIFSIKLSDHNSTNIMIDRVASLIESDIKKAQLIASFFNNEIHLYLKRNKFETKENGLSAILQYCEKNHKKYKTVEAILDKYKKQIVQVEQQYISEALMGNFPPALNTSIAKKNKI